MLTREPELTVPVDLCTGRRLSPEARGWSRRPLHRANLTGVWGRTKRWDYWAVLSPELVVSVVYADVDYLGLIAVGWADLATHATGGRTVTVPFARGVSLPAEVCTGRLRHSSRPLDLEIAYDEDATRIRASWYEPGGTEGSLDVEVADPPGHESLNVVIPWSAKRFQYTSKHQARPATGTLVAAGRAVDFGATESWGVLDVGRGRWPYRTRWNWGGGAGRSRDGKVVGLQIGGRWTVGTGFTENGVIVDGRLLKIGEELTWTYRWDAPLEPWRVCSSDGAFDLTLVPVHDRHERTNLGLLSTEVHQVFGRWSGTVPDGDGSVLDVDGLLGFAEESRSRW